MSPMPLNYELFTLLMLLSATQGHKQVCCSFKYSKICMGYL